MQVIPSIDTDSITDFSRQIKALIPHYQRFQIDYADGLFVPFTSVSLAEAIPALEQFESITFDFHLMTKDLEGSLNSILNSSILHRVKTVFMHHAAQPDGQFSKNSDKSFETGLVLNPEDSVDTIKHSYDLDTIKNIQIMSIDPGPQGSPFLPNTINKIEQLRDAGYRYKIYLDGGINRDSLKMIRAQNHLPDFICPGSFFSRAKNLEEQVRYLSELG